MRYLHFGETKPIEMQDKEEACIKRICKHFGWNCDVAPNPEASNYEQIKLNLREYIALGDAHTSFRFLSSTRGEGYSSWLVFEDFLEWMDVVEWFSETDWFQHFNDDRCYPWTVRNPFFGKHLRSIEEVSIFLDLLEASHHFATGVNSKANEWKQEDTKGPEKSQ